MTLTVASLLARAEIADVLARYAHAADRADWELLRSCYHVDAIDQHGPYRGGVAGLVDFVQGVAETVTATQHQLGQQWVVLDAGNEAADVETYCLAWYGRASRRTGEQWSILQGLRYLDRLDRRDGRWAIARRAVVMDWEHTSPVTTAPRLEQWLRGGRGQADPSTAFFQGGAPGV